ncbi:MAG: murein L,D-transpeptidase [Alphaproteobacteria bacterium]|nr:MAG: murein L,D-transpeptidase [Alphaproteobacteria bacterium]
MKGMIVKPAVLALTAFAALSGCETPPPGADRPGPDEGTTVTSSSGTLPPPPPEERVTMESPGPNKVLAVVDLSDQRLTVVRGFDDGRPPETHRWVVSTGIDRKPTPKGQFYPDFLSPDHVSSIYHVPMPWSVFFNGNIAIHGDPETRMLGVPASNGCVRVHPEQAKVFYEMVEDVGLRNTTIIVRD